MGGYKIFHDSSLIFHLTKFITRAARIIEEVIATPKARDSNNIIVSNFFISPP